MKVEVMEVEVEVVVGEAAAAAVTVAPRPLVIFHLQMAIVVITATSIRKRMMIESASVPATTSTGLPPLTADARSHGSGSPTSTSKMFDPTLDDTAMSPLPSRATSTDVSRSGTEVPAARKVSPITTVGM